MSTVLVVLVVLAPRVPPSLSSPLKVSHTKFAVYSLANHSLDSKQARDLVGILTESKQQIDPRLHEMARYGGGGGGGGRWGGGRGRGRGGGGGKIKPMSCYMSRTN